MKKLAQTVQFMSSIRYASAVTQLCANQDVKSMQLVTFVS